MQKRYGATDRQDGLYKAGRNKWDVFYGFGKDSDDSDTGWNWYERFNHRPTREEIVALINKQIDAATDERIANGMVWNGKPVRLDTESQTNILGILVNLPYDDGSMFPMTFKLGDYADSTPAFHEFASAEEFAGFAKAATDHKQTAYAEGWQEKVLLKSINFDPQ